MPPLCTDTETENRVEVNIPQILSLLSDLSRLSIPLVGMSLFAKCLIAFQHYYRGKHDFEKLLLFFFF